MGETFHVVPDLAWFKNEDRVCFCVRPIVYNMVIDPLGRPYTITGFDDEF